MPETKYTPSETVGTAVEYLGDTDSYGFDSKDIAGFIQESQKDYKNPDKIAALASVDPLVKETKLAELMQDYMSDKLPRLKAKRLVAIETGDKAMLEEYNEKITGLQKNFREYAKEQLPLYTENREEKLNDLYKRYQDYNENSPIGMIIDDTLDTTEEFLGGMVEGLYGSSSNTLIGLSDLFGADQFAEEERMREQLNSFDWQDLHYAEARGRAYEYKGKEYIITDTGMIIDHTNKKNITAIAEKLGITEEDIESGKGLGVKSSSSGVGYMKAGANTIGDLAFQIASTKGIGGAVGATTKRGLMLTSAGVQSGMIASSVYNETYEQLSAAGIEEETAKAESAKIAFGVAAVTLPTHFISPNISPIGFSKTGIDRGFVKGVADSYAKGGTKLVKKYLNPFLKEGGGEVVEELVEGTTQKALNVNANENLGIKILEEDMSVSEFKETVILSFLVGGLGSVSGSPSGKTGRLSSFKALSKDMDKSISLIRGMESEGVFTKDTANKVVRDLNLFNKYSNQVPVDTKVGKVEPLFDLLDKRDNLEVGLKNKNKAFHKGIKEQIDAVDSDIAALLNSPVETKLKSEEAKPKVSITPETSSNYANMTEEGDNFVFFHNGSDGYTEVKPTTGESTVTSKEEAAALSKVGGMAMYYTDPNQSEKQKASTSKYAVKVPKDKVYDFNTDPDNLIEEAERRHKEEHPDKAFDKNTQVAYVTKIAGERGYDMVVSEWAGGKTRAQTTQALKPTDVQTLEGNKVKQPFSGEYKGNKERGFDSVVPRTKQQALQGVYDAINKARNAENNYDELYRLRDKQGDYSQKEISSMIEGSDLSQELKDQYQEAMDYQPKGRSSRVVQKSKTNKVESAPKGVYINVGLIEGTTDKEYDQSIIKKSLPKDVKVLESGIVDGSEKTISIKLSRPLTDLEMKNLLAATKQDAIPQISDGDGVMFGSDEWGGFDPNYFMMPNNTKLISNESNDKKTKETTTGGDNKGKASGSSNRDAKVPEGDKADSTSLADRVREKFKTNTTIRDSMRGLNSNAPKELFDLAWDAAVEAVALSIEAGVSISESIRVGIKKLKGSEWYQSLSKEGQREAEMSFIDEVNEVESDTPERAYERLKSEMESSRNQSKKSDVPILKKISQAIGSITTELIDRQHKVKTALEKAGMGKVVDYIVTKAGASSLAKNRSEKAYQNTLAGLTNFEVNKLEEIIIARRIIAIDKNRAERGQKPIKHQGNQTGKSSAMALEGARLELGDKTFNKLSKRADNYFQEYKEILEEMKSEGLISEDTYELFKGVDYQPREFIDFMEDMDGEFLIEELHAIENLPLSKKQMTSFKEGFDGNQLTDAWYILQKSILSRTKAVFINRLNTAFHSEFVKTAAEVDALIEKGNLTKREQKKVDNFENVRKQVKLDSVVGFTDAGNPKYKMDNVNTKGYTAMYFYKDGVKQRIWVKEDLATHINDSHMKHLSAPAKENFALISGKAIVQTFATGNNPFFFITNTPRDFWFTVTFSKEYGNEIITNSVKLAIGAAKGLRSVFINGEDYVKYLEYGGGMDWLQLQGKYSGKGIAKAMVDTVMNQKTQDAITRNKVKVFMDKFNLASEVGIRIAVFNKSIKNQLKELGEKDIETLPKQERDWIYTQAARSARELTDFNQGGRATKAADSFVPYLNAGTQGIRAAVESFGRDPIGVGSRMVQVMAYTAGGMLALGINLIGMLRDDEEEDEEIKGKTNIEIYLKTIEGVSQYDLTNYFIIPTGKKNKDGNWGYYRVAKAHSLTPLLNIAEHYMRKALAESSGAEYRGDASKIFFGAVEKNLIPIELSPTGFLTRIPAVNAMAAMNGDDLYTGNPLSWDKGEIPAELEGIIDDRVEPFYKKLGEGVGKSPLRLKKAVESYVTTPNTNPYIASSYAIGNMVTSNKGVSETFKEARLDMKKALTSRMFKHTSEYNVTAKLLEGVSKDVVSAYREHIILEDKVKTLIGEIKKKDLDKAQGVDSIKKLADEYPEHSLNIVKWVNSEVKKKTLKPLVASLKYERNKQVRAIILAEKYGDLFIDRKNLSEEERKILAEFVTEKAVDSETYNYYRELYKN